jgi:hypothetical protein
MSWEFYHLKWTRFYYKLMFFFLFVYIKIKHTNLVMSFNLSSEETIHMHTSSEPCFICCSVPPLLHPPQITRKWITMKCCHKLICSSCNDKTSDKCPFCRNESQKRNSPIKLILYRVYQFNS